VEYGMHQGRVVEVQVEVVGEHALGVGVSGTGDRDHGSQDTQSLAEQS
jgi:hypothetical protein